MATSSIFSSGSRVVRDCSARFGHMRMCVMGFCSNAPPRRIRAWLAFASVAGPTSS